MTEAANCERTLSYPLRPGTVAPIRYARHSTAMPASIDIRIPTIRMSVRDADLVRGSLNAITPLLTASTPIMAVQPLEKALNKSHALTAVCAGPGECGGTAGIGWPPAAM